MLYLAEKFKLLRMFPDLKNYIYGLLQTRVGSLKSRLTLLDVLHKMTYASVLFFSA